MATPVLYHIEISHYNEKARWALDYKGIPHVRKAPPPMLHTAWAFAMTRTATFPVLKLNGSTIGDSTRIIEALERSHPEPALYPADPDQRAAVEEAERWGHEVLQAPVRRILWNTLKRDRAPLRSYAEGAKLGVPIGLAVKTAAPIVAAAARMNSADDEVVRADLAALPAQLQQVDDWIADGVLGADPPNAADLQIAASLRLAMTVDDLRPAIEERPAGQMALRAIPDFPGHAPPVLPPAWLEPLRAKQGASA